MKISIFTACIIFVGCIAIATAMPWLWPNLYTRLLAWAVLMVGTSLFAYAFLSSAGNRGRAVLVDPNNRLSLPNVVTLCWFVVLVSAYLAAALFNMHFWVGGTDPLPLNITIPAGVWVLAGITVAHLAGTSVIGYQKKLAEAQHPLRKHASASDANFSDLVTYDEADAGDKMDLTSLQQLLFQIAAVVVYAVALGVLMAKTDITKPLLAFPTIPDGFLALLGVSAAGNLVNRAIPR
jgi:hypothetical protein